jgi:hypothetical protein
MKNRSAFIVVLLLLLAANSASYGRNQFPMVEGSYLGQKPPGRIPEAFAPGIVTTEHYEFSGVFTPDLKEFYLIRDGGKYEQAALVVFRNENDSWSEAVVSPRTGQPFVAPDGKIMHLGRRYMELTEAGWSELKSLPAPVGDMPIMRLTASSAGTYFFDEFRRDLTGDIRYSRLVNGEREEPRLLGEKINGGRSFHPFIAPDESYLIFDSKRDGGQGDSDLYISYRMQDGSWGEPINLGIGINTERWEAAGPVTPDGKYFFFNRNMSLEGHKNVDIFWVDARFIEELRPKQ